MKGRDAGSENGGSGKRRAVAKEPVARPKHDRARASTPAELAGRYETVALVFQGGGALGAYQCGVYEALHEAGIRPAWFSGTSIGAINAAILAGNAPEHRLERLREFWNTICVPAGPFGGFAGIADWLPTGGPLDGWLNALGAFGAIAHGQQGFFAPRLLPPFMLNDGSPASTSFYDTTPLKATLERLVDFDRINSDGVRLSIGATNVASGNFRYFDSALERIRPEHVLASGALPPAFPAVVVDGEQYWDGGLVSNTPLEYVLAERPYERP
jgi:NTE family protein